MIEFEDVRMIFGIPETELTEEEKVRFLKMAFNFHLNNITIQELLQGFDFEIIDWSDEDLDEIKEEMLTFEKTNLRKYPFASAVDTFRKKLDKFGEAAKALQAKNTKVTRENYHTTHFDCFELYVNLMTKPIKRNVT
jgi:hypothetical protein